METTREGVPELMDPKQLRTWEDAADPLADRTVASWLEPDQPLDSASIAQASRMMSDWTSNGVLVQWAPATDADEANNKVGPALQRYLSEGAALPNWADPEKLTRGEKLFMDHGPLACTLLFCSSLPECYVLPNLAEVLQIAGQLEANTEHRIRQTAAMVFPVMMRGGLTSPQGAGVAQVLKVRLIHATIRHLILRGTPGTGMGGQPIVLEAEQPVKLHQALGAHGWDVSTQGQPCNQVELAYTLLTFGYCFLRAMRKLNQRLAREDEEAFLHTWNVMGHVLGIQYKLMAHTMDDAEALFDLIREQARHQQPHPDPRPALGRALSKTMAQAIAVPVIRHLPVPLTQWLMGPKAARLVGIGEHVPWLTRLTFRTGLLLTQGVDGIVRLWAPHFSLSRMFTRVLGYHLLTQLLLSQTRPLHLPDQLIDAMHQTVATWGHDACAHSVLNQLEDRMTTQGPWTVNRRPSRQAT